MKSGKWIVKPDDMDKVLAGKWLRALGYDISTDDDGDIGFDLTPFFACYLTISPALMEFVTVNQVDNLSHSLKLILVNTLNARRQSPKWVVTDAGSVLCAMRHALHNPVCLPEFGRYVRTFGMHALAGFCFLDSAGQRFQQRQDQADSTDVVTDIEGATESTDDIAKDWVAVEKLLH